MGNGEGRRRRRMKLFCVVIFLSLYLIAVKGFNERNTGDRASASDIYMGVSKAEANGDIEMAGLVSETSHAELEWEKWLYNESNGYQWQEYSFSDCDITIDPSYNGKPLPWDKEMEIEFCHIRSYWFLSDQTQFSGKRLCDDLIIRHLRSKWSSITVLEKHKLQSCTRAYSKQAMTDFNISYIALKKGYWAHGF